MCRQIVYSNHYIAEIIELLHDELVSAKLLYQRTTHCCNHLRASSISLLPDIIKKQEMLIISLQKTIDALEYYRDSISFADQRAAHDAEIFALQTMKQYRDV